MKWLNGSEGSVAVVALSILLLMTAVAAGGIAVLQAALRNVHASRERDAVRMTLEKAGDLAIQALSRDPTPESDSPLDPVWSEISGLDQEGVHVQLQDISSALNPNWIERNPFQKTGLANLMRPGAAVDDLQQRREDKGFSMDISSAYEGLFKPKVLETYFTAWSYANINVTDEFALQKIFVIRTRNDSGSEGFHERIQKLRMQKKLLKRDELRGFLGLDYETLFPVVNAEPLLNVHYLDPVVLTELLGNEDLKLREPRQLALSILEARDRTELSIDDLKRLVGASEGNRVYQYLGVTTWFWKISVVAKTNTLELVVARLPLESPGTPRFLLVSERYQR